MCSFVWRKKQRQEKKEKQTNKTKNKKIRYTVIVHVALLQKQN